VSDCQWTRRRDGKPECSVCGYVYPKPYEASLARLHRNCSKAKGGKAPQRPAFMPEDEQTAKAGSERLGVTWADARHYGASLVRWVRAGFPTRTDEDVAQFEATCRACEHYRSGRCAKCGCRVSTGPAVVNKIKMLTEVCPVGKWGDPSQVGNYAPTDSGLLVPGEKKPVLAGMHPEDFVPKAFGPMLPQSVARMGRRRCCPVLGAYVCDLCSGNTPQSVESVIDNFATTSETCYTCPDLNGTFELTLCENNCVWFYAFLTPITCTSPFALTLYGWKLWHAAEEGDWQVEIVYQSLAGGCTGQSGLNQFYSDHAACDWNNESFPVGLHQIFCNSANATCFVTAL